MTALLIGAALAVAALLYVLFPLFDNVASSVNPSRARPVEAPETAIDALREIEFDKATGKLSDADYASLKAEYTRTALVELRSREEPSTAPVAAPNVEGLDAAEAAVLRYRSMRRECDTCGPRPEPDPAFCSNCGKYLKGKCSHCGATVDAPASRFCANCGSSLAA
jgi:cytochrome c-type biogenesis protein CcmI